MNTYKSSVLVFILTPFVFSFALGLDIYIPIIPQITEIFNTTPALVQLTLSLFLLMTGAGQLVIGPLSDQYGRKATFYFSSILFLLGSIFCAFAPGIGFLILGRFISAIGACGLLVTAFALVRDLYSKDESAQMYSFLNGAIGISPTFAPIIGGYLFLYFGWQSIFFFLGLIGLLSFVMTASFIKETLPSQNRIKMDKGLLKRYLSILANRQFMAYSLIAGIAEAIFFCFFSISPFIIITIHDVPTHEFGYYFASFGAVIGLGGVAGGKLIEKVGIAKTVNLGIILMFIGGISMLSCYYLHHQTLPCFLIPMLFACTGAIFLVGCAASKALEPFESIAGTASAAFGAIEFAIPSLLGSLLMLYPVTSPLPYSILICFLAILCTLILRIEKRRLARNC